MLFSITVWLVIFSLIVISFSTDKIPFWFPILLYVISVFVRIKKIIGNYRDMEKKNIRDEKLQLEQKAEEMAEIGLAYSGRRIKKENKIKEDYEFENKKRKRKLWVDIINVLFLK